LYIEIAMNIKLTKRLEEAIKKLYLAYTNNTLDPECACHCAAGNICNNNENWKYFTDFHGSAQLNYIGRIHQSFGRNFNGYLPLELLRVEAAFLKGCGYELPYHYKNRKPKNSKDRDIQFNGLYAAISYLCDLDGIENVMDIMKYFVDGKKVF